VINTIPPGEHDRIQIIGRSQGYLGLAVYYHTVIDAVAGYEAPALTTAYKPTPDELARLNAGESVVVRLLHLTQHPPIMVTVSEPPE
jgi:hypothetical protein